jgi:hypothetical protein
MSTLSGKYINQTYEGVVHLSTNAAAVPTANTSLEDGTGQNLGISLNTNGTVTATTFVGNLSGTATSASFSTTLGASLSSPANNQVRLLNSNGGTLATVTVNNVTSASFADNANVAISSSFASNSTLLNGTGSRVFATTGSNTFIGNQIITGNQTITGNFIISGSTTVTGPSSNNVNILSSTPGTASLDFNQGNFFTLTLVGGSNIYLNPTNIKAGQNINLQITQAASSLGTLTFAPSITFPYGAAYTASIALNNVDVISMTSFNGSTIRAVSSLNFIS